MKKNAKAAEALAANLDDVTGLLATASRLVEDLKKESRPHYGHVGDADSLRRSLIDALLPFYTHAGGSEKVAKRTLLAEARSRKAAQ